MTEEEQQNIVSNYIVTVQPFKLGKHEVTFAQWDACVGRWRLQQLSSD